MAANSVILTRDGRSPIWMGNSKLYQQNGPCNHKYENAYISIVLQLLLRDT